MNTNGLASRSIQAGPSRKPREKTVKLKVGQCVGSAHGIYGAGDVGLVVHTYGGEGW